jgi:hypothetical protein
MLILLHVHPPKYRVSPSDRAKVFFFFQHRSLSPHARRAWKTDDDDDDDR